MVSHELLTPMKSHPEEHPDLALKIAILDAKLADLEDEIREIGQPAGHELSRRLEVLRIEDKALKRNFEESRQRGEPDSVRLEKIEKLLDHIAREEVSMEEDAHFLHQAAPSSVGLAVEAVARIVELYRRAFHRALGDHHPLGSSVFVNHSHESIAAEFGLPRSRTSGAAHDGVDP